MAGSSKSVHFKDSDTGFLADVNSGSTQHNEFHPPPGGDELPPAYQYFERPQTPPQPSTNIPFRRNGNFVERAGLLDRLDKRLSLAGGRVALVGLGGIGKTQQAVEYTYRVRERSPETWVLWMNANSRAQFEQSVRSIADRARIAERNDPNVNLLQLFRAWLEDARNGRWLVVLDNVDDASFLVTRSLFDRLPVCEHGAGLITTRSRSAALKLVEHDEIVRIGPMDEKDAVALLSLKLGEDADSAQLRELAAALEYIPLAMIEAASYIKRKEWRSSVQDYLRELQRSDESQTALLDGAADTVVMRTWQISFERILVVRRSAAELLSLMSLCDRQGIPEFLLRGQVNATKRRAFDRDVEALLGFSFVSAQVHSGGTTFEVHRLVQLAMRKWRATRNELSGDVEAFVSALSDAFPTAPRRRENWDVCQALFPHVKSAMGFVPDSRDGKLQWASTMLKGAEYAAAKRGILLVQAIEMGQRSWEMREAVLGEKHADTLVSMSAVADYHDQAGDFNKSQAMGERCLKMQESTLGEAHGDTLITMEVLAETYTHLGAKERAKEMGERCWRLRSKAFGEKDARTLRAMRQVAWLHHDVGDSKTAAEIGERCCKMTVEELGEDSVQTVLVMDETAVFYSALGDSRRAAETGERCLGKLKEAFGDDHPSTLLSMMNLAGYYYELGENRKAMELGERCWEMYKSALGDSHPRTLTSEKNWATYLRTDGQIPRATLLLEDCVERSIAVLGSEHPVTKDRAATLKRWQRTTPKPTPQPAPSPIPQPTPGPRLRDRLRRLLG